NQQTVIFGGTVVSRRGLLDFLRRRTVLSTLLHKSYIRPITESKKFVSNITRKVGFHFTTVVKYIISDPPSIVIIIVLKAERVAGGSPVKPKQLRSAAIVGDVYVVYKQDIRR
ncbi:MAG: hypothetical protein FWD91_05820, partial [Treponema sp.]|nr:hypothetical protein [Treponema sp.]